MKYAIDETELARLVAKACRRPKPTTFDELRNAVPALVAEVRRLREKVEAWEWFDEADCLYDNVALLFDLRECAIDELYATITATREAVHADRE